MAYELDSGIIQNADSRRGEVGADEQPLPLQLGVEVSQCGLLADALACNSSLTYMFSELRMGAEAGEDVKLSMGITEDVRYVEPIREPSRRPVSRVVDAVWRGVGPSGGRQVVVVAAVD